MGGRCQIRPAGRRGLDCLACLLAACALAALPAAASTTALDRAAPLASDTVPDGLASEVFGRVVQQGGSDGVGQARLVFRRLVDDSVIDSVAATTASDGTFRVEYVPAGNYALVTEHLGFETRRDTLLVPIGKSIKFVVPVAAEPVPLRPLRVDVRSGWLVETGFYRRQALGFGQFLEPDDLEHRSVNNLTQALQTVPGVEAGRSCFAGTCGEGLRMSHTNSLRRCEVKYYMDGEEMHGPVFTDNISMHGVAAVEVYRNISETPAQFYGRCGSVVIWSERAGG